MPPQRHSSIRTVINTAPNVDSTGGPLSGVGVGSGTGASVSRLVIDLEAKFGKRFHNVTEFSKPPPFLNIEKMYPSRTLKASNGM